LNHEIFVADAAPTAVSVVNDSEVTVIANIQAGSSPDAIAFDPSNNDIYVANAGANSVS